MFFWVRRVTIASSFLRSYFAPWPSSPITCHHRAIITAPSPWACSIRLLVFPTRATDVLTAVIAA
jgi:hypothetical protein